MTMCRMVKYDPNITEAPFEFIAIGAFECVKPKDDYLGESLYEILNDCCAQQSERFKCYSDSQDENFDYDVVVY